MSSSLAKELLKLNRAAPSSIDPEADGLLEAEAGGIGSAIADDVWKEEEKSVTKRVPEGRRLRAADDVTYHDPKYSGRAVTRAQAFANSSEEEEEEEESDEEENDGNEISDEMGVDSAQEEARRDENSSDSSQSQVQDEESVEEEEEEEEESENEKVVIRGVKRARQDPEHVKNQMSLWSELVGFRIRMQGLLVASERFPDTRDLAAFSKVEPKVQEQVSSISGKACDVLEKLLELRSLTYKQSSVESPTLESKIVKGDIDTSWEVVQDSNKVVENMYMKTFDTWHRETMAKALGGLKLKALNKTLSEQVEAVMSSGSKVLERSQLRSTKVKPITIDEQEGKSDDDENIIDPEIYNDTAFYKQLLLNFVSNSNSNTASRVADIDDQEVQSRLATKLKKQKKERKFFKGKDRIIDYKVHEKLVNFVAPRLPVHTPIDTEQLFVSLFQG